MYVFFSKLFCFSKEIDKSIGLAILRDLDNSVSEVSVTSLRVEQKTTLLTKDLEKIIAPYTSEENFDTNKKNKKVYFVARDPQPKEGKNITFTFYAGNCSFYNGFVKTSIKLRLRYYLT